MSGRGFIVFTEVGQNAMLTKFGALSLRVSPTSTNTRHSPVEGNPPYAEYKCDLLRGGAGGCV